MAIRNDSRAPLFPLLWVLVVGLVFAAGCPSTTPGGDGDDEVVVQVDGPRIYQLVADMEGRMGRYNAVPVAAAPGMGADDAEAYGSAFAETAQPRDLTFNADGTLTFALVMSDGEKTVSNLATMSGMAGELQMITDGDFLDVSPCWSIAQPGYLYFAANRHNNYLDLWALYMGGGVQPEMMDTDTGSNMQVAAAPDGGFAFVVDPINMEEVMPQLYYWPADGLMRHLGTGWDPAFGPDGILYYASGEENGNARIYALDVANANATAGPITNASENAGHPAVSPDGMQVAYCVAQPGAGEEPAAGYATDIWMVGADGSNPTPLTSGDAYDMYPAFHPTDAYVYFASNRGDAWGIWMLPVNSGYGQMPEEPVVGPEEPEEPEQPEEPVVGPEQPEEPEMPALTRAEMNPQQTVEAWLDAVVAGDAAQMDAFWDPDVTTTPLAAQLASGLWLGITEGTVATMDYTEGADVAYVSGQWNFGVDTYDFWVWLRLMDPAEGEGWCIRVVRELQPLTLPTLARRPADITAPAALMAAFTDAVHANDEVGMLNCLHPTIQADSVRADVWRNALEAETLTAPQVPTFDAYADRSYWMVFINDAGTYVAWAIVGTVPDGGIYIYDIPAGPRPGTQPEFRAAADALAADLDA